MKALRGTLTLELHVHGDQVTVLPSYVGESGERLFDFEPITLPTGSTWNLSPVWGVLRLRFGPTADLQFFVDPETCEIRHAD